MASIDELNRRFAIPGVAQITSGNGGLPRVSIATPWLPRRSICMARRLRRGVRPGMRM